MKRISLSVVISIFWTGYAQAAPLTFNTALPVSQGEFVFREQFVVIQSDGTSGLGRDRTETDLVSTLVYGITPDLAIFGTAPYTNKKLESSTGATHKSQGLGDSKVFARYTVYTDDFQGGSFRIAPFAGLKVPTGKDDKRDNLGLLPVSVQAGTGSWDIFGGLVATYGTVDWELDGQIGYQENPEANNFESGDIARADVSFQYRLFPQTLSSNTDYFINGVLEANLIKKGRNKIAGIFDLNSGGTTLFLVPGLQYVSERYIAEISVQIPVAQNLNGTALENDFIFRTGFRINF